jgi:TM2 domain-containing membrane protein YozV
MSDGHRDDGSGVDGPDGPDESGGSGVGDAVPPEEGTATAPSPTGGPGDASPDESAGSDGAGSGPGGDASPASASSDDTPGGTTARSEARSFVGGTPPVPDEEKSPGVAALASLVLPGAGQAYNGQFVRGAAVFVAAAALFVAFSLVVTVLAILTLGLGSVLFLLWPLVHFAAAYDAYRGAQKANAARDGSGAGEATV